jgi:hypothetical protein
MWMPAEEKAKTDSTTLKSTAFGSANTPRVQVSLFEFSGAAVVPGGILLADDELVGSVYFAPETAFDDLFLTQVKIERKRKDAAPFSKDSKLIPVQDFEGLASHDGLVYLLGSHQAHRSHDRRSDREFLIQAKWDDDELDFEKTYDGLLLHIANVLTSNGLSVSLTDTTVTPIINLEGLAVNDGRFWLGIREPLIDGNAILLEANIESLRTDNPQFVLFQLSLSGAGIRGLHWDVDNQRLLLLSGGKDDGGDIDLDIIPGIWQVKPGTTTATLIHSFTEEQLGAPAGERRAKPEALSILSDGRIAVYMDGEGNPGNRVLYIDP